MDIDPYLNPNSQIQLLARRLMGALPHIDIDGTDFTIDWRLREMRETAAPWNKINLDSMWEFESGEKYVAFYNTEEKQLFDLDENLLELPENVARLEIPNEIKLDPVAVAREYGVDIVEFVQLHPITQDLKGFIRPVNETGLVEFVAENQKKAAREGQGRKL